MVDDAELLRRYANSGSQEAFTQFVERHLTVVYFAALRRTNGNAALAEEIAQYVFRQVAGQAGALARHTSLTGWLYTTTRHAAAKTIRAEDTRRRHEHNAAMDELTSAEPAQEWERLRPVIDDALDALDDRDREAILIRFFESQPFAEVGATLRISQDAARKRVDRALDKLRLTLERRGIKSASAALATVLATQGGLALPAGLLATVSGSAISVGAASAGAATLLGLMSATKVTVGITSAIAVLATWSTLDQRNRAHEAEAALAATRGERVALMGKLAGAEDRARQAEARALEAEKDNGTLLEAVEATQAKQQQAARPPPYVFGLLADIARNRPEQVVIDTIEWNDSGVVLRGGLAAESSEKGIRILGGFAEQLRRDAKIAAVFRDAKMTDINRSRGDSIKFEIVLLLKIPRS